MDRNGKVSITVIILAVGLIFIAVFVFSIHRSLSCPGSSAPLNTTLSRAELVRLQMENQSLQRQKEQLKHLEQEMDALKGNLTDRVNEVLALKEQVFNVSSENQRLQDDIVTWKQKSNSTSKKLQKVQEQCQLQNKEYEKNITNLELKLRNHNSRTNGVSPGTVGVFGWKMLAVLLLLPFWL